jgi:hypothetical protein
LRAGARRHERDPEACGDFADGVIAFEGRRAGGKVVATFDEKAAALIRATGGETRMLGKGWT